MSSFYHYKDKSQVCETFESPRYELRTRLAEQISRLKPIGRFTYLCHWVINGRAFAEKRRVSADEVLQTTLARLERDFNWAISKGWAAEIKLCDHIEEQFGLSVFVCMKRQDTEDQGWVVLEQVVLKRTSGDFTLWSYADDE